MSQFLKRLLGSDGENEEKIKQKSIEAHAIKNKMTVDILQGKKRIDTINLNTYNKLKRISDDLADVTYNIGIATGIKRRGFKG